MSGLIKNKNDKAIEAEKRANALEPKIPKLRIELPAGILQLKGLEIRLDGELIQSAAVGSTLPHDPGEASFRLQIAIFRHVPSGQPCEARGN